MTRDEEQRHAAAPTTAFTLFEVKEWSAILEVVHRDGVSAQKLVPVECIPPGARVGDLLYLTTEPTPPADNPKCGLCKATLEGSRPETLVCPVCATVREPAK